MRTTVCMFVLVLATALASAQPANNAAADTALAEGRRLYDVQEWDRAIAKFKEAYTLRPDAAALFNIAQSYRLRGDCAQAASFYKTYKRNFSKEKNIDKVDKFIVEMDACARAATAQPTGTMTTPTTTTPTTTTPTTTTPTIATTTPTTTEPTTPPAPTTVAEPTMTPVALPPQPEEPPQRAGSRNGLKWGGIAAIGIGAIALGLGVKFALNGRGYNDDLRDACRVECSSATALAIESDGVAANRKAVTFTAVGGVALAAGVVMFVLSRGGTSESSAMSFMPAPGGLTAAYVGSF